MHLLTHDQQAATQDSTTSTGTQPCTTTGF